MSWKHYTVKAKVAAVQIDGSTTIPELIDRLKEDVHLTEVEMMRLDLTDLNEEIQISDWLVLGTTGKIFVVSDEQMNESYIITP